MKSVLAGVAAAALAVAVASPALAALKAGHFYASQGPEIRHAEVQDDKIVVECSAVTSVIVQGAGSAARAVHGQTLTRAEVPLERFTGSDWLRVSVIDRAGKRAWTNPIRR